MNILRLIIYIFSFLTLSLSAQETKENSFTIDDLVSLYNAGEIDEFLAKAKEIQPSIRGPKWRAMVAQFTIQKIESLLKLPSSIIGFEDIQKVEGYALYTHHLKNLELQNKKLELGLKYLTSVLKDIDKWEISKVLELKKWWFTHW